MKRRLVFCILFTVASFCFSQAKEFEGYDNLAWGTTVEQFLTKNPSAFESTNEEDRLRNERCFVKEVSRAIRVYRFFDDKLWWGRTVYQNPNEATYLAILEKIVEDHGMPDTNAEESSYGDYFSYSWYKSPTFSIMYEFDIRQQQHTHYVLITYTNDEISEAVDEYERKKIKQSLEL